MKIYIDLVMIMNFIFDFVLLVSVNYILRRNVKWMRLVLSSLFGTVTLLILFIPFNNITMIIYKLLVSVIMILIAFGYRDFLYFKKNIIYFYLVSMLMGGAIEFLDTQFSYSNNGIGFINNGRSISYIVVLIIGLYMFYRYIVSFKDLKNNYSNYYKCSLYFDDLNYVDVSAYLDTGNKLSDPYSNKSIILIDKCLVNEVNIRSPIYVPYNSLNNHGLLKCFKPFKIVIDGKENDKFLVGISEEKFYMDGIDCIINTQIMEGLR